MFKLLANMIKKTDLKFRKIVSTNKTLAKLLFAYKEVTEILILIGFEPDEEKVNYINHVQTSDLKKKYSFTTTENGKQTTVERELTSKDIDRLTNSIVYGSEAKDNSFIPDEFKPLAEHMASRPRLEATISAGLIKDLKSLPSL